MTPTHPASPAYSSHTALFTGHRQSDSQYIQDSQNPQKTHSWGMTSSPMPVWYLLALALSSVVYVTQSLPVQDVKDLNDVIINQDDNTCKADFVEKFVRLMSGPLGTEADALLASVMKLLSKNDRVNFAGTAVSQNSLPKLTDGKPSFSQKRLKPDFNPTGWRRKRDVGRRMKIRRALQGLYDMLESSDVVNIASQSWLKRDRSQDRAMFNPTGW
ncbi:uncharacterized protein LOC124291548 [Haliotis rubra]|uniref:uncharacterized protein LOC124291548 n=1 Tax=Haliotis rubra TaxID=36100 RepID=UPI001EE51D3B|nr:uncharacterized protein LOC124291548 [Haliotis rubra]